MIEAKNDGFIIINDNINDINKQFLIYDFKNLSNTFRKIELNTIRQTINKYYKNYIITKFIQNN